MILYNENSLYSDASYSEWDHPEYYTFTTATTRHLADSSSNANNETTNIIDNATSLINSSFTFQTRVFDTPNIATKLSATNRFGSTNEFASLLDTPAEREDYMKGLAWLGILVASVFTCWLIVLLIFCCCGRKRVGFLSGSPLTRRSKTQAYGESQNSAVSINENSAINKNDNGDDCSYHSSTFDAKQQSVYRSDDDDGDVYIESDDGKNNDTMEANARSLARGSFRHSNSGSNSSARKKNHSSTTSSDEEEETEGRIDNPFPDGTDAPEQREASFTNRRNNNDSNKAAAGGCSFSSCLICGYDLTVWIRSIFILSGIVVILFSILFVTQGLTNFQKTVDTVNDASQDIQYITSQTLNELNAGVIIIQEQAQPLLQQLSSSLQDENLCPTNPDLSQSTSLNEIIDAAKEVISGLEILSQYSLSPDFKDLAAQLDSSEKMANEVYDVTKDIDITDWESVVVLVLYTIIPCIIVASAMLAAASSSEQPSSSYKTFRGTIVWIFFPLFIFLIIAAAIFCAAFIILATMNSDFCYPEQYTTNPLSLIRTSANDTARVEEIRVNAPDVSALQMIQLIGFEKTSNEYKIASFYITQCAKSDNPFSVIIEYLPELDRSKAVMQHLTDLLLDPATADELSALCERSFENLDGEIEEMQSIVAKLSNSVTNIMRLLGCNSVVPIYQSMFYNAACDKSLKAFIWTFSASLVVAFFGFLMISFRAAYSDTLYIEDITDYYNSDKNARPVSDNSLVEKFQKTCDETDEGFGSGPLHGKEEVRDGDDIHSKGDDK